MYLIILSSWQLIIQQYISPQVKKRRYAPPPNFKPLTLSHALRGKELWLVQVPPGVDVHQLAGTKVKLKNNKAVSLSEVGAWDRILH